MNRDTEWKQIDQSKYKNFVDKNNIVFSQPPTIESLLECLKIIFKEDGFRIRTYNSKEKSLWEFSYWNEEMEKWDEKTHGNDLWNLLVHEVIGRIK